jgi:hypothetical protein
MVAHPAATLWSTFRVSPSARHRNSRHLHAVRAAAPSRAALKPRVTRRALRISSRPRSGARRAAAPARGCSGPVHAARPCTARSARSGGRHRRWTARAMNRCARPSAPRPVRSRPTRAAHALASSRARPARAASPRNRRASRSARLAVGRTHGPHRGRKPNTTRSANHRARDRTPRAEKRGALFFSRAPIARASPDPSPHFHTDVVPSYCLETLQTYRTSQPRRNVLWCPQRPP